MPEEHQPNGSAVRISNLEIYNEVRAIGGRVDRVAQTLDENVKPSILRHASIIEEQEKQILALNIKFYGILGGFTLSLVAIVAQAMGVV